MSETAQHRGQCGLCPCNAFRREGTHCQCGHSDYQHVLANGQAETIPAPPPFQLDLDPFERIEKAAAEWRNAYRASERGDAAAVCRHSSLAIAHTLQLSAGLR